MILFCNTHIFCCCWQIRRITWEETDSGKWRGPPPRIEVAFNETNSFLLTVMFGIDRSRFDNRNNAVFYKNVIATQVSAVCKGSIQYIHRRSCVGKSPNGWKHRKIERNIFVILLEWEQKIKTWLLIRWKLRKRARATINCKWTKLLDRPFLHLRIRSDRQPYSTSVVLR